jgi:hypothetical protein
LLAGSLPSPLYFSSSYRFAGCFDCPKAKIVDGHGGLLGPGFRSLVPGSPLVMMRAHVWKMALLSACVLTDAWVQIPLPAPQPLFSIHTEHYQPRSLCRGKKFVLNQSTLVSYRRWGPFTLTKRANEGSMGPVPPDYEPGSVLRRALDRVLLQKPLLCREETRSRNFWRGVPPFEPILALEFFYSPGSGESPVFVMWQVSVPVNEQDRRGQNACPDC